MSRLHTLVFGCLTACTVFLFGQCSTTTDTLLPGTLPDGKVRLPNGWLLSPAGTHVGVGELPLNMAVTPDEQYLLVLNNGTKEQTLSVVDIPSWKIVQSVQLEQSWLGLSMYDNGRKFLLSAGNGNRVDVYNFTRGHASRIDSIVFGQPWPTEKIWVEGLDVDDASETAYVTARENASVYSIDLHANKILVRAQLPAAPYTCLVSTKHPYLYVSLWGGASVAVFDRASMTVRATVPVGDHPTDMAESSDGRRLFVADANLNSVSVVDLERLRVTETLCSALSPAAPNGSTPNALAVSPDGTRLYVANADNNCIAVFDISADGRSQPLGFIPTAWYPTSVRVIHGGSEILVASAKGLSSRANPGGPNPAKRNPSEDYIGSMFHGVISRVSVPDTKALEGYTAQVYSNSLYSEARRSTPGSANGNPIPSIPGSPSPIRYVFYIIKENRTYDQVFGDISTGNGDSSLCLFPERITPNHHALAREFVLLDNLYCDAEVSADGHNWSMGAYATDVVEKTWPTVYGGRGGDYIYSGESPMVYPTSGYLWDACERQGVSFRTYGEFATTPDRVDDTTRGYLPVLQGHVAPLYRGWDLSYSDVDRVKAWMKEFDAYERSGDLPRFCSFTLPNDHTSGTHTGARTPRAYVAQNDLALGMLIDRISHSRYWKECAIFVIEDDAQNGPDHVDAHRTVALMVSPFCRRHITDSNLYSTCSMVRTIELILGLPPLSQFDAGAPPMYDSFTSTPDLTPYTALLSRIDIDEKNIAGAYGQGRSDRMDFTRPDAAPEDDLNEILWTAARGSLRDYPPLARNASVRPVGRDSRDD